MKTQNETLKSSFSMRDKKEESHLEYVIEKMAQIYNFNPEDQEQLILYRELIRNAILLYNKSKELENSEYGEQ